jgi:MFS family permease
MGTFPMLCWAQTSIGASGMFAIFVAILVTLVSMYLAGYIAQRRGRSVKHWLWIGAAIGPFALALLFCCQQRKAAIEPAGTKGERRSRRRYRRRHYGR